MRTVTVLALAGLAVTLYFLIHVRAWLGDDTYAAFITARYLLCVLAIFAGLLVSGIRTLSR